MTATTMSIDFSREDTARTALGAMVDERVVALTAPDSPAGEQYRILRHRLERISRERGVKSFAITSSMNGEGKTITAVNLALALGVAEGRRVALLDFDLRKGRVHSVLGFSPRHGLSDVLAGTIEPSAVMWRFAESGVYVMPAGRPPEDPAALLAGTRASGLMSALREGFDVIIVDMPALLSTADAQVGLELCEAALLMVRAGRTPREVVEMALDAMPADKLVGCVLNEVAPHESVELAPAFASYQAPQDRGSRRLLADGRESRRSHSALPAAK